MVTKIGLRRSREKVNLPLRALGQFQNQLFCLVTPVIDTIAAVLRIVRLIQSLQDAGMSAMIIVIVKTYHFTLSRRSIPTHLANFC